MRARPWLGWAALAAALALLNFALTFANLWPTPWIRPQAAVSIELAVAVLLAAVAVWSRGPLSSRALGLLSAAFVVLVLTRYAEVMARELYGRPINLYYDLPHVPRVVAMFAEAAPAWVLLAISAGVALGLVALFGVVRWAWGRVAAALAAPRLRGALVAVSLGVIAAYPFAPGWFAAPVTASYVRQAVLAAHVFRGGGAGLAESPPLASDLARVRGTDVFVVFLESYGAATFDRHEHATRIAPSRDALAAAAAATGRAIVSAFVESPTFGGASWLAHASLLAGVEVRDGDAYNALITQRRRTLVRTFADRGYRTVALMPGLRQDWREGEWFYGFDAIYGAARLDYRGPEFGWWRIPDQYALAKFDQLEVAPHPRRPLFVFFPTITSHAPFRPVPPYQPDWQRLLGPQPYDPSVARELQGYRAEWQNLDPAYADAVSYSLEWLGGYLREQRGAELVLVVLGDHQPPVGVGGEHPSWEVPVHVIARPGPLLDALVADGFVAGPAPRRPGIGGMVDLTRLLVRAFGSDLEPGVDVARARRQAAQHRPDRIGL
jgi:Sulfatase